MNNSDFTRFFHQINLTYNRTIDSFTTCEQFKDFFIEIDRDFINIENLITQKLSYEDIDIKQAIEAQAHNACIHNFVNDFLKTRGFKRKEGIEIVVYEE